MKDFSKTNYHYFFFIILFLIQISIFNDFGFPNDEEISRFNGLVSYNYILEKFDIQILQPYPNTPKLENYIDKDYGVIFELFLVFMERILDLKILNQFIFQDISLLQSSFSLVVYIFI